MEEKQVNSSCAKMIIAIVLTACIVFVGTSIYYMIKLADAEGYDFVDSTSYSKLDRVKNILKNNFLFEYDEDALLDGAINGMLETLDDPYTVYYTAQEWDNFMTETEGEYEGVGLYITYDT